MLYNEYKTPKRFRDEKYIYLLMAYMLAKNNGGKVKIGKEYLTFKGGLLYDIVVTIKG